MGDKANSIVESVLTALVRDFGPKRFAVALNNVCCHGEVFEDSPITIDLDDDDEMMQAWFKGIETLIEVGKWMEGGKRPKLLPAQLKEFEHDDADEFEKEDDDDTGRKWVITTQDFENLIFNTLGVKLRVTNCDEVAEHRFHSLTKREFIQAMIEMRDEGCRVAGLCDYIYRMTEFEVIREKRGNPMLRNIIFNRPWHITSKELAALIYDSVRVRLMFVGCNSLTDHLIPNMDRVTFEADLKELVKCGGRVSDLCQYIHNIAGLECVLTGSGNKKLSKVIKASK